MSENRRCPACLALLIDPIPSRCPLCQKRLQPRARRAMFQPKRSKTSAESTPFIDLPRHESYEAGSDTWAARTPAAAGVPAAATSAAPPAVAPPAVAAPAAVAAPPEATPPAAPAPTAAPGSTDHTTIFEPSQLNPEMRGLLDDLYRKARAELDDDGK